MAERTPRSGRPPRARDMVSRRLTDKEVLAQIPAARARAAALDAREPRAAAARYDDERGLVIIELTNGAFFGFPAALGQGLRGATRRELEAIEISPSGEAVRWPMLDMDLRVPALLRGMFGTRAWMRMLAQAGGQATSEAKVRAARENGRKGGRPRKTTATRMEK